MPRRSLLQLESSLSFNGTTSRVNIANATNLVTGSAFTIAAWVKPTNLTNPGTIYGGDRGGGGISDLDFRLEAATGKVELLKAAVASMGKSTGTCPLNTWSHVAVTYNNPTVTFYINAVASGTASSAQTFTSVNKYIGTYVSAGGPTYSDYFTGLLSSVYHYPTALTAGNIASIMAGTPPDGALGIWKLNENSDIITNNIVNMSTNKGIINAGTWSSDVPPIKVSRNVSGLRLAR